MDLAISMAARFLKDEEGATAIEYALIASAILFAILAAIQLIGAQLVALFELLVTGVGIVQS